MTRVQPYKNKKLAIAKNSARALKVVKQLARGGPMKMFLNHVHPFTRALRILVGAWRWIESAQCRRGEVGVEEALVCCKLYNEVWCFCVYVLSASTVT